MAGSDASTREGSSVVHGDLLSDQVYSLLRRDIVTGELAPGTRLVESEIARNLQVSQAPVRDAVKRLAHEGLVTYVRRRGNYVTEISEEEGRQARQVRTVLEEFAARCLVERLDEVGDLLDGMAEDVERMREVAVAGDHAAFRDHDAAFHRKLCMASGNTYLLRLWDSMEPAMRALHVVSDPGFYGDWGDMADDHARLLALLRAGEPDGAARAIAEHASGQGPVPDERLTRRRSRGGGRGGARAHSAG